MPHEDFRTFRKGPRARKYKTIKELADEIRRGATARGFKVCPVADWLYSLPDDGSYDAATEAIVQLYAHPEHGPSILHDSLLFADAHPAEKEFHAHIQYYAAYHLTHDHPFEKVRGMIEQLFADPTMKFISREALETLVDFMRANHPNFEAWVAQDHVQRFLQNPPPYTEPR